MKVHLVFDSNAVELAEFIKGQGQYILSGWDYTFDTIAQWAMSKKGEDPDIILVSGTCDIAQVDLVTGEHNRDQAILRRLKDIRISRPESRIVILLHPEKEDSKQFLTGLVSLGIYDIYFVSEFGREDVLKWLNSKKTIIDVQHFLPTVTTDKTNMVNTAKLADILPVFDSKDAGNVGKQPSKIQSNNVFKKRTGPIILSLAINSEDLHKWFTSTFSRLVNIKIIESIDHDEIKQHVYDKEPDILILMRNGPMGGIPESEHLVEWAVNDVPAVLYIAGELDDEGKRIVRQVESIGVSHILTCPEGGFISGEELVFHVHNIVKELKESNINEQTNDKDTDQDKKSIIDNLSVFKKGVSRLGGILKTSSQEEDNDDQPKIKNRKKHKNKASLKEGISLNDSGTNEQDETVEISHSNAIIPGGIFAVVTPWRPGLAGRLCAQVVKMMAGVEDSIVAYIGASSLSTGSIWLDITDEELIMSDWRVPGSQAPIEKGNIEIYAVDPVKNIKGNYDDELWKMVKSVRKKATYTVIDFADDINSAQKAAFQGWAVLLVVVPGGDPVETKTTIHWLKALQEGKKNVITGIDLRGAPPSIPEGIKPKMTIRNNPADALDMALKINDKAELHWAK